MSHAMSQSYYTWRIRISSRDHVQAEIYDPNNDLIAEPFGKLDFNSQTEARIQELCQIAHEGRLMDLAGELGDRLFDALFDAGLRRDLFNLYRQARRERALLRLELDVDERELPSIAALPWEFMRVPSAAEYRALWLATSPDLIFSRRRACWNVPKPLQLKAGERLRLAVAVADPNDLGPVKYEDVWQALQQLSSDQADRIELLDLVRPATAKMIDEVLEEQPHLFHFIGHARLKDENQRDMGQIALVNDKWSNTAKWFDAEGFSELFTRHEPGVVLLQACEGAALSASAAFVGVASKVIQQNVPVVVAMQYEISNLTAQHFAMEFYKRLAEDDPVDRAVQEGRRSIALGPTGYTTRDFATPVLFMRVRAGYLFQRLTHDKNGKALVVEDDEAWQIQLEKCLSSTGYKVDVVENYQQAIGKLQKQNYLVATIDLNLDEADIVSGGRILLEHIKRTHPETKCIVVTGANLENRDVRDLLKECGADDYMGKLDFKVREFMIMLEEALQ